MKKPFALLLANGAPPSRALAASLRKSAAIFVCADGGANTAARFGLVPDAIVGDLDSVLPAVLRRFRAVPAVRIAEQESTDLEKAINWILALKRFRTIVILGAAGKRLDHTVSNLGVLPRFARLARIVVVDDESELLAVGKGITVPVPPGTLVSLLPLTRCTGVRTGGLQYPLYGETLELGAREGTSNVAVKSRVRVAVRTGKLLMYIRTGAENASAMNR